MKKDLHIIESNNLFGLADNYNMNYNNKNEYG